MRIPEARARSSGSTTDETFHILGLFFCFDANSEKTCFFSFLKKKLKQNKNFSAHKNEELCFLPLLVRKYGNHSAAEPLI
jgi:hypothetical protein